MDINIIIKKIFFNFSFRKIIIIINYFKELLIFLKYKIKTKELFLVFISFYENINAIISPGK